uniref:UBC core domain-containing protein n=1 Tax=Ciona savignyi TaxID=51511 RepID=H2YEH1_CIOSA
MPNTIRRFARLIVKRLRRVTSSTSSPPVGRLPGDAIHEQIEQDGGQVETDMLNVAEVQNHVISDDVSSSSSSCCVHLKWEEPSGADKNEETDAAKEEDTVEELESMRGLRIEDALIESRRMQDTIENRPKTVNGRRLMKEFRFLKKASEDSQGAFEVSPSTDIDGEASDLSEWDIKYYKFDESSHLWRSMVDHGVDFIHFRVSFPSDFPFSPPFVRLVSPYIENGFVMNGGAICLEVLTAQGWSSAYTVEALLVQVAAALAHGGAVVSKHQKRKQHKLTKKRAEAEFQRIVKIHSKYGWVKLDKEEG